MASESMKKFFITVSGYHLGATALENVSGEDALADFLGKQNLITLCVTLTSNNDRKCLKFYTEVSILHDRLLVFYKIRPCVLTEENLLVSIQIASVNGSPAAALYHSLQNVFSPLLLKNERRSASHTNIQRQLANLQAGLRNAVLSVGNNAEILEHVEDNTLTVILSLEHEVEYWNNVANSSKGREQRAGIAFKDILQPLARDFSVLDALPLADVEDLLENAHNILDDLWRHDPPYPEPRVRHLMDLIAADIIKCISKNLSSTDVWSKDFNEISELLHQCISVLNHWESSCKQLTEIFWPNYSMHIWSAKPYVPQNLLELINRLQEVLNARIIHRQLVRLLSASEETDLNTQGMFKPFEEIDILDCGAYVEPVWKTAFKKFEYLLEPAEQLVANKLKKQLTNINANTRQLLYEFGRYSELIERPVVKQALRTERQYLLSSLNDYVQQLFTKLATETPVFSTKYDTPQVVHEIITTQQLESKANDIKTISEKLLDDLPNNEDLLQSVKQLLEGIKQQHTELFDSWTREVSVKIKNNSLSLRETDPVVQFSASKMMKVNYSSQLVTLINEVRQLTAFGYRIPNNIEETSSHAKQFMKHAKILEQIANFHNTIGDRMIPSQRPMMLASALELSKLVQEQEVVSWGNVNSVEKYVQNLKLAVEQLAQENNLLTSYHLQMIEKIKQLEDIDLIKYYQKWKETTKSMCDMISQIEQKGFKSMNSWKTHIDQKLCKILEVQYLKSLDTLHLYLPEIHCDLIYRDLQLQFSPSKEALREKYQQQLKRFLDIPKTFRGVSDDTNIFSDIIQRNKTELEKVNTNTDELMEQLNGVVRHWQSWLSLGTLDTTQLISWEHWDLHFRASKTFGQEIAKLPSTEERVGCFIIGLSWLRSDLESHNRSYWSQLVSSLKDSIGQDVFKLQQYVDRSTATLNRQPLTLEQIGEADESHSDVLKQKPEMETLYQEMIRKSQMLASWTRERVDSVNRLQAAWERLQSLLDNYEHIIARQMETMKTTLNIASENLQSDIERFTAKWEQTKSRSYSGQISEDSIEDLQKYLMVVKEKREQLNELAANKEKLLSDYDRFGMQKPEFPVFEKTEKDIVQEEQTWIMFEEFWQDFEKLSKEEWIVFRKKSYRLEEFLINWQTKLEETENTPIVTRILQEIHKYQNAVPALKYVRGEDFTEKHWIETFTMLGMTPKPIDILCLQDFLNVSDSLVDHSKELQSLCKRAASEIVVRQALTELDQWDVQSRFILTSHTDSHGKTIMLIKDFKEILNKIGDNQSLLQSVKNSADYVNFSERAELWETRLAELDQNLTNLAQIQRKWVYLEPIFGGGTLDHEKARFERLDKDFRYLLSYINREPRVTALIRYPNLKSILDNLQDQLSRCQNSLDNFLAEKRNKFPRFLFLGDDDLLEVVGQSSKEQVIQTHLKKLFAGIHSINLDMSGKNINAICSLQGEVVPLSNPVNIDQPVEDWLNLLVKEMQVSLKKLLVQCLSDGQSADPLRYPSQILCLADSIMFTSRCENAITNMTLPPLLANYKTQLNHYSSLEFNESTDKSLQSNSDEEDTDSDVLELKLKALLLDAIHHINVIENLIKENVVKVNDWNWQKQLRYYADSVGNVTIKMVNAQMEYSYEYLGNQSKLVRTPLTDKCFLTLTQGMHLGMGGNPYGPAGTGKTESVKTLGSLLGRQVLVFNCDEGIDASSMGRILSGLVRSGAWGCFDEFNRLDEATLSAVSMHIQPIQNALRLKQNSLILLDQEIQVDKHCGIFITLNPAGGNYGGRNKLPDSLKQLFRPVVMTDPDQEQIATTLLHCDGYKHVNVIGCKLIEVFSCASKLLSKQQHYDWGLRSLRTVLSGCGRNIRQFRKRIGFSNTLSLDNELELVVKSLRMDTLSKLSYTDSIKLDSLIKDIFPSVLFENSGHESLIATLESSCIELGIEKNSRQINKCVELYEQLKQRMGVAIVGPPCSGKSTIRNLLFNALTKTGKILKQHVFNPKSMPRNELFGQIDNDTRQWSDGVLTVYSLQVTAEPLDVWSWIVCDGDVDPEWIESLNSVLDDNKLLTLPSGWRIQFGPNVNFLFETHNLSNASPATISRMGIVFLSEEDMSLGEQITNFISKQPESIQGVLGRYIQDYFYKSIDWLISDEELITTLSKVSMASTGLSQLNGVVSKAQFVIGLLNGLGGYLSNSGRQNFANKVFEWTGELQPPSSIFYYYNKDRDAIDCYTNTISSTSVETVEEELPLIMTAQVCQTLDCLRTWLKTGGEQHFLLVGQHGSAKTLLLKYIVKERTDMEMVTIYCSTHLSPQYVIQKLSQSCIIVNSSKGRIYKPKKGHLVLHFKNLDLLKLDQWGTNMLIAFLQQLVTYKGLFDRNLDWVGVENITIVCSLTNIKNLSVRFTSIIHIFNVSPPDTEELNIIFTSYVSSLIRKRFTNNSAWANNKTLKLTTTIISIYNEIKNNFNSVQEQLYNFSPHDLTKWCKSILHYKTDSTKENLEDYLLEILCYEAQRLFRDRFINENDCKKFDDIINRLIKQHWGKSNFLQYLEKIFYTPPLQFTASSKSVSISRLATDEWTEVVQKGVTQYEREGEHLNVLIIPELLHLTSGISKALTGPGGGLLLIGRAGVGRRSSVKIISALQSAKLVTIITSEQPQFNINLKVAMQQAGLEDEDVYLLFEDHILNNSNTIDTLNTLLCSGEVPGLYTSPELDSLVSGLKDEASRENYEGNLMEFFIERIRKRLHIIVCLEFNNTNLSKILEDCPALYQLCTVMWLSEWSKYTMEAMPLMLIEKANNENVNKTDKVEATKGFAEIHGLIKPHIASPMYYTSMIKLYIDTYNQKKNVISSRQSKLQAGVSKLTEARNVVAELKIRAAEQKQKLAEKQSKANTALDMISNTMKSANTQKQEMEVLKQNTEKESVQLGRRKKEIELELAEVQPLIDAARAAVGNIKPEALSEIRSLRAPPDMIRDILEGVLRLMGTQDTSWNSMKNFLSKRGVKEDIRSFDASKISSESRQAVERLMSTKSDSFDPKHAKRASVAAAPLAAWVTANVRYSLVLDKIKPLEMEQNKLKQNLATAELQLEELSTGLSDVDDTVGKLKSQLATYTKEAAEIEIHLRAAEDTLATAEGLVGKLNDEYERWQVQLKDLSGELKILPNNCLLASAFITYLSGESEDDRMHLLNEWIKVLSVNDSSFSLEEFLSSEREQLQWQSEGLSADKLSFQNAIIILNTNIAPLLLDPTSSASDWIKMHLKSKTIEITTQNSPKFNTTLELAVRFGKVLIIEEVEAISSVLLSILRHQFVYQGERKLININGKLTDFHTGFQLFLCCRNTQLQLTADTTAVIKVVNFITTRAGLAEQLLRNAIKQESPDLENRRRELLKQREELQEKQHNLQNQLLEDLASATGDILQNKNLMTSLNETKASSSSISAALIESVEIQKKLQEEYDIYKEISDFGSKLYFAAREFSNINVMYSLSVPAYIRLFLKSLPPLNKTDRNYGFLQRSLLQTVYHFMSRGIFKADRLKFALHLCNKMLPRQITYEEWNIFLGQSFTKSRPDTTKIAENLPPWIPDGAIQILNSIQSELPNFYDSLQLNEQALWKGFMENNNCEANFPSHCQISEFQKVLVVQALRGDRLHSALLQCVLRLTGLQSLKPEILQLSSLFKETLPSEPILLITTSGTDPSSEIKDLANTKIGSEKLIEIAMGEGQEARALEALQEAAEFGHWLILKNLHLITSWLPILCQNLQRLKPDKEFRLWLITEPHTNFSSVLAQNSLKIAYEVPAGIKSNLLRTYSSWGHQYIEKLNPTGARMLFVLGCLHALLQERRTYIPQGWSKPYEFTDIDLSTTAKLALELWKLQNNMQVPWKYLIGLCSDAIYGGRIENVQDLAILGAYLRQYFTDDVLSHRWKPIGTNVSLPTYSNFEDYVSSINQLSDRDLPSYFGLPENIDRAWEQSVALEVIMQLRGMTLMQTKTGKFLKEDWQKKLMPFLSLWKKLNQGHDYTRIAIPARTNEGSSIQIFLSEEYCEALNLIQYIHKYFSILNKISKGNLVPEDRDLQLANDLLTHNTPKIWQNLWYGPKDPSKYLKSVMQKMSNISKWKNLQNAETFLQQPINLSLLFHPDTFLAANKQDFSRKSGIPMDELILKSSWKPTTGTSVITLKGLLVEGAVFDGQNLSTCSANSDSITVVPDCYINWVKKEGALEDGKTMKVPLYYTSSREEILTHIQIVTNLKEKDKWILAGLAFFIAY